MRTVFVFDLAVHVHALDDSGFHFGYKLKAGARVQLQPQHTATRELHLQ